MVDLKICDPIIIPFGAYKGKELSDQAVPDGYVKWMANRGAYTSPGNRFEPTWKVPIVLSIQARREMERRGYKHDGEHWKKGEGGDDDQERNE